MKIETIRKLVEMKLEIDLSTKSRKRHYVYGRAIYYQLCRLLTKHTLTTIGDSVGQNHATVLNGFKVYDEVISQGYEPFYNKVYNSCRRKLRGDISVENAILSDSLREVRKYIEGVERRIDEIEEEFFANK